MALNINAVFAEEKIDKSKLKEELKEYFKCKNNINETSWDKAIEFSNIMPKNDFICYLVQLPGVVYKEDGMDDDFPYKYHIDFAINNKENYKIGENIEKFLKYISEKYEIEMLVELYDVPSYIMKNGKIIKKDLISNDKDFEQKKGEKIEELRFIKKDVKRINRKTIRKCSIIIIFCIWFLIQTIAAISLYIDPNEGNKKLWLFLAMLSIFVIIIFIIAIAQELIKNKGLLNTKIIITTSGIEIEEPNYNQFFHWKGMEFIIIGTIALIRDHDNIVEVNLKKDDLSSCSEIVREKLYEILDSQPFRNDILAVCTHNYFNQYYLPKLNINLVKIIKDTWKKS